MGIRTQKAAMRYICDGGPVVVIGRTGSRTPRRFVETTTGCIHWVGVTWQEWHFKLHGNSLYPHGNDWRYELCEF